MTNNRPLTERELSLINLYANCQLGMSPWQFYSKWSVSYEQLAFICNRSTATVRHWFRRGKNYRRPMPSDLRHLALMDLILEHYEEIPPELRSLLCPATRN